MRNRDATRDKGLELWEIRKGRRTCKNHNKGNEKEGKLLEVITRKMESTENCIYKSFFHLSMHPHLITVLIRRF
jgi:hypothetical protein